ncbi:hypothetical protein [Aldersonia kunmingensis]|uniref:hypothetical protein n=1 Tax=Aldersonia kunmingensis TaxID=408066 RepID=UPI00082CF697|nr:hypothetical protein [Aldersonia kunmingensis]
MSKESWKIFLGFDRVLPRRSYWLYWALVVIFALSMIVGDWSWWTALWAVGMAGAISSIIGHHFAKARLGKDLPEGRAE